MKAILYIFIVKPLLSRPLEILRYYTIPSMAFCNLSSILIINYYEDLDNAKYLYACTLVWIAIEVLALTTCYTALASFFASKADDLIGGTYMAVLWTSEYSFFCRKLSLYSFKLFKHNRRVGDDQTNWRF